MQDIELLFARQSSFVMLPLDYMRQRFETILVTRFSNALLPRWSDS